MNSIPFAFSDLFIDIQKLIIYILFGHSFRLNKIFMGKIQNKGNEDLMFTFANSENNLEFSGINAKILKKLFSPDEINWLTAVNLEYKKIVRNGKSFLEIRVSSKP